MPPLPPADPNAPGTSRMTTVVVVYGLLALVGLIIAAARGDGDIYAVGNASTTSRLLHPLLGVGVGLAIVAASRLATHYFERARHLHNAFFDVLGPLPHREIVVLACASSIAEEVLFRGALMPWLGLGPQALIFGLLHLGPDRRFLPWTVSAALAGWGFGALSLWSGDLGAATTAHFVVNYLNLRYIAQGRLPVAASDSSASSRPPS